MNIVFFGTSEFAIPSLKALIGSRHKVSCLVTRPDRPSGRRLTLSHPPTKTLAEANGIPVFQPADASGPESVNYLKGLQPDLFIVISFGQILKKEALAIPKLYPVNVHGSLLPGYRGAAPTNWAIINGDEKTGVTIIRMNERMDEGDIILRRELAIEEEDTNVTLSEKLSQVGATALMELVDMLAGGGKAAFQKQDGALVSYAPKLKKADGLINWNEPAIAIRNKVRGLMPWPGAYTLYDGKSLKIISAFITDGYPQVKGAAGEVVGLVRGKGIIVRTGAGYLAINALQLEGKKPLDADSFLRGHRVEKGYVFPSHEKTSMI